MSLAPQTVVEVSATKTRSYVDWPAIFAGAILASALSFVLLTFGTGIGLSLTSPYPEHATSATAFALALGLWVLWTSISSFVAGAYLAGRMRRPVGDATPHEIDVRDGVHGLIVWAVSVLIGAILAVSLTGAAAGKATDAAGTAMMATAEVAKTADPTAYWTDMILRPGAASPSAVGGTPAGANANPEAWQSAQRILSSRMTDGKLSDADHAYLAQLVARNTGLSEADANAQVDATVNGLAQAKAQAQQLAEKARKFGILITFLTAASLAVAAAASWWGAVMGGNHRDEARDFSHLIGSRIVRRRP